MPKFLHLLLIVYDFVFVLLLFLAFKFLLFLKLRSLHFKVFQECRRLIFRNLSELLADLILKILVCVFEFLHFKGRFLNRLVKFLVVFLCDSANPTDSLACRSYYTSYDTTFCKSLCDIVDRVHTCLNIVHSLSHTVISKCVEH